MKNFIVKGKKMKHNDFCTGCGACLNICHKGAISMTEDEYGFVFPSIDREKCVNCGLCDKVCDRIDALNKSYPLKTYAVSSKNTELSQKSSSGGMFAELAKSVLSNDGVVFGCAMERVEDGFDVKHIYIENEKDLYKLQGSKYVQSDIENSYLEAKKYLEENREVLFSGTPCQIAGLRAFLNKDYENLLTVDLSCEGVPSLKLFNDYIHYLEKEIIKYPINDFKFRDKSKFGWSTQGFVAKYKKQGIEKLKIIRQQLSSYFYLFIHGGIHRRSCYNCQFNGLNRVSDITIADCWGFEESYPFLLKENDGIFDKNNGISLVLVNSVKGQTFFDKISEKIIKYNVNVEKLKQYNGPLRKKNIINNSLEYLEEYKNNGYIGLDNLFKKNLGYFKMLYYSVLPFIPRFIKNLYKFLFFQKHYDCLLMTMYYLSNYGSLLTAYALSKSVSDLGYSNRIIHYGNMCGYSKRFCSNYLKLTKRCITNKDFNQLNKLTNTFILGSDNLINFETNSMNFATKCLLNFTNNDKKRLMISGSIGGWDGKLKTDEQKQYIKFLLNRFDYVSTREEHGKTVFENEYGVSADWINDPVFYIDKSEYEKLAEKSNLKFNKDTVMSYVLYPNENTNEIKHHLLNSGDYEEISFDGNENVKFFGNEKADRVEDWLYSVINSKLIVTDSFHCVCFALIFNKPFVCLKNSHATVRFTSLFKRFGIDIPLIECVDDLSDLLSYDKNIVNNTLEDIKTFAITQLRQNLEKVKCLDLENAEMDKYNSEFIKSSESWYKKNKLFYYVIIKGIVVPLRRLISDFK